jgi:phosphomannomutase
MLIFAIDDEPKSLELLHDTIAQAAPEAEIRDYPLGTAAIDAIMAQHLRPNIVFTDIQMPELDGLALATQVRAASPATRLVFVTAYSEYAFDAIQVRTSGYVMKPVDTDAIRKRRLRIVLDPMFGVSLTGLQTILYTARCDIDVINDRHDAFFGRHLPAPNPDTLVDLQYAVKEHTADVGIATDGDADRLGIIDEKGRYVTANETLALLYYYLMEYKGWRGAAVRNIATTHLLDRIAKAYGQECIEVPVGFKHISAGMEAHDALIGGESSGGLTVRGHISGKDGLYAASLLVEMISVTGKKLSELVTDLFRQFGELHTAEYDWPLTQEVRDEIYSTVMEEQRLPDFGRKIERISRMDGCKVYLEGGWVITRFSGTEPRVRIFAEAETEAEARRLVGIMANHTGLAWEG